MRAPHARTESMAPHPTHRKHDEIRSPLNTPDQSRISSTKASTRTPYHSGLTNTRYPLEEFEHIHPTIHVSPTHPIHYKSFNTYTVSLLSLTHIIHYKNFNTHTRTHARTHTHTLYHSCLINTLYHSHAIIHVSQTHPSTHAPYYSHLINTPYITHMPSIDNLVHVSPTLPIPFKHFHTHILSLTSH